MIWPQEDTLVSRTQPSGPLCLWQCFSLIFGSCCSNHYDILTNSVFFSFGTNFFILVLVLCSLGYLGLNIVSVLDKDLPRLIAKITPCVWNVLYNTNILPRLTTWTLGRASDFVDFFLFTNSHFFSDSGHVCVSYVLAFNSSIVNQFLSATKECLLFFVWPKTKTFLAGLLLDFSGTFPRSLFLCEHNLQFSREI